MRRVAAGILLIVGGLILLSRFATSPPADELQRRARRDISVIGVGNILFGLAQLVPSIEAQLVLTGLSAVLMMTMAARLIRSRKASNSRPQL